MGFFDDPIGVELRHYVGVDRIMWSTDFPHIVTRWPHSLQVMEEQMAGVPRNEKRQQCWPAMPSSFSTSTGIKCRTSGAHGPAGQVSPLFEGTDWVNIRSPSRDNEIFFTRQIVPQERHL